VVASLIETAFLETVFEAVDPIVEQQVYSSLVSD
jgi:hypothetical protein